MNDGPVVIRIHPSDNVAVAVRDLAAGTQVRIDGHALAARDAVAAGHKIAIRPIARGSLVVKYGFPIGAATADIQTGEHVHTHNLGSRLQGVDSYEYRDPAGAKCVSMGNSSSQSPPLDKGGQGGVLNACGALSREEPPSIPPWQGGKVAEQQRGDLAEQKRGKEAEQQRGEEAAQKGRKVVEREGGKDAVRQDGKDFVRQGVENESTEARQSDVMFEGYLRAEGLAGIRNEIWIIPTVGCVNKICTRLAAHGREQFGRAGIDGIFAFEHPYGCSQLGDDLANTQRVLAGLVRHPNAGGVLVVGLGCENNNLAEFRKVLGEVDGDRVRFLASQEVEDEYAAGMAMLAKLVERASATRRELLPISKLVVGLKCGGSDGFSGITANPLLGIISDWLTGHGATTLLTEVPEMFGAEPVLLDRCVDRDVFGRCVAMINTFKDYYLRHGQAIDENPSPGNREGGITTLEEKSLGCVQKGGCAAVADVLEYGQRVRRAGLSLVSGPGNDAVSTTALAASGAQMILFTTGRGTPLGGPVPTVKVATTGELARRKRSWIDFDAGPLLTGESLQAAGNRLFQLILQIASGRRQTRNEENDFREIAIFKDGVTL